MASFFTRLWDVVRPYKVRFFGGTILGMLAGLKDPMLVGSIWFIFAVVFPQKTSPSFSTDDIVNLPAFTEQLAQHTNQVAAFVWTQLSDSTRESITSFEQSGADQGPLKAALVTDLNRLLRSGPIYDPQRFASVSLSPEARSMLVDNQTGEQLAKLNRMVLEDAFPGELANNASDVQKSINRMARTWPGGAHWLSRAVDNLATQPTLMTALSVFAILPITMFLGGLINYGYIYYMTWVGVRAIGDLRAKIYHHLLHLPPAFLLKQSTGDLMARVSSDVSTLHNLISNSLVSIVRDPITLIVLIGSQVVFQPKLTLMSLIILPVSLVPVIIFTKKLKKSAVATQNANADVFRSMHEGLSGARVVKAYNLEPVALADFQERIKGYNSHYMRTTRASEIPGPLIEFFGALGVTGLLASIALTKGDTTAAGFLTFVISIQMSYTKLKYLVRLITQIIQARAASSRVFEILDTPSDLPEPTDPKPVKAAGAEIRFDNITFGYDEHELFRDFNLTVKPGQLVALVGQSGSGKTTLTNLLLRFYDPQEGAVRIGGTDIREVTSSDLRAQISVVTQETILFNESIRRNIELGRPGASDADIEEAARHAYADDFIRKTPHGYDTVIGEKGASLSGGQRQRLAIARAILKNAPILILDEATSALDTEAERAVQAALDELMQGRTTICIAHRLSTIQHADVIVVMEGGRIVEMGNHRELLERGGLYQKLHQLQFRE